MTMIDHAVRPASSTPIVSPSAWAYFRKVFAAAISTVLMGVAAMLVVLSLATHETSSGDYQAFGHPVLSMLSGSMSPVIPTGSLVVDKSVTAAQAQNLHVGQVISFRIAANSSVVITHRIVRVERTSAGVFYVTKGDANSSVDSPARPAANVFGVESYVIPEGGYILNAAHRPAVIVLFLLIVMFGLSVGPLIRWVRRGDEPVLSTSEVTA